jgi:hypothetical protein
MKKILIVLTVFIPLFSCNKSNEVKEQYIIQAALEFSVFNSQNKDLLDTVTANHIEESEIKLFYQVDGEIKLAYDADLQFPRHFYIYKHENEYRICVGLNDTETSDRPVTYIQWNENDTDTIEVIFDRTSNGIIQKKIWLNRNLIWEQGDNTVDPYFILTK